MRRSSSLTDLLDVSKNHIIRKNKSLNDISVLQSFPKPKISKRDLVYLRRNERNYGKVVVNTVQDFLFVREVIHSQGINSLFMISMMIYTMEEEQKARRLGIISAFGIIMYMINTGLKI